MILFISFEEGSEGVTPADYGKYCEEGTRAFYCYKCGRPTCYGGCL